MCDDAVYDAISVPYSLAQEFADLPVALLHPADKLLGQVADLLGQRGQVPIRAGSAIPTSALGRGYATLGRRSRRSSPTAARGTAPAALTLLAGDPVEVRGDGAF